MISASSADDREIGRLLDQLGREPAAAASRTRVCEQIAHALNTIGEAVWVSGAILGPDRKLGKSPFGFGSDAAVGVATVMQIGGQLAAGAISLLNAKNAYAAASLIRQLVEVEYLAHAFSEEHESAATWLRAGRKERLDYWAPARLRERGGGKFLAKDYSQHCDLGGHPTTKALSLLPGHRMLNPTFLWVDLAGHLLGIWRRSLVGAERLIGSEVEQLVRVTPDVDAAIEAWLRSDGLFAALADLSRLRSEQRTGSEGRPGPSESTT